MGRRVSILGSTGSIGENTLDIIGRADPGTYKVAALTANRNVELLAKQALQFQPEFVAIADPSKAEELNTLLSGQGIEIGIGGKAVIEAGQRPADFVMASIVGAAGLRPTLAAVEQGAYIGLANKECLVCAGELFMQRVDAHGATLLPVDSEHNAIFQVLEQDKPDGVRRLILTASGGPFRETSMAELETVGPEQALNHPVWSMGAKISIDSATLMNKGLELIEASFLFDRPSSEIDVLIHPQSIVHSMVEYVDGSVLAQMGSPDMRTPIAYALGWPERIPAPVERLNLAKIGNLSFHAPDNDRFPALGLARKALNAGGHASNILNAANEVAVETFLDKKLSFLGISEIVARCLEASDTITEGCQNVHDIDALSAVDQRTRETAKGLIKAL